MAEESAAEGIFPELSIPLFPKISFNLDLEELLNIEKHHNLPTSEAASSNPIPSPPPTANDEKPPVEAVKSELSKQWTDEKRKSSLQQASKTSADEKTDIKVEAIMQKDIPLAQEESKKSVLSLGPRGSKEISRTAKYMNTYKLDSEKPFNVDKVEKILKEVLMEALDNLTYDADKVPKQAKWASSMIRAKVKEQEYDRYKLVCNVTIGEKRSQDMFATYRFLWDAERDKHACYVYENMYVYAIAVCFGIYYE
ncbi:t-complex-associated-testis-expressed 1/ dynein light chain [Holotrichia oblita]|uniref:T-complex-associated-testis-expressed 1/ dynein light chain n=3 Tax=Holotrichia oblita TaxID=644536 RepID=A0ACB9TKK5_HOLOL|nr:t-complex-associated-testis-expressed 1/ dynein light chain [Holotrichia oblita]KAI4467324.1 t-complex-associated-testis-expressed 1/ dynein light chain [Holotrichia oblita]KAI4467349.1 t-complex-associated-testis-expressed 1/ dynein light chain [Holotrichia oblita]